jgi:hypothetical protein
VLRKWVKVEKSPSPPAMDSTNKPLICIGQMFSNLKQLASKRIFGGNIPAEAVT